MVSIVLSIGSVPNVMREEIHTSEKYLQICSLTQFYPRNEKCVMSTSHDFMFFAQKDVFLFNIISFSFLGIVIPPRR